MFTIREALPRDLEGVRAAARVLDSMNLPDDREALARLIEDSRRSFAGEPARERRVFLFVMEEPGSGRAVGTTMIFAQHGTRDAPHAYFEVGEEQRYSQTLDKLFVHRVLRLGFHYDGPTEIGGLALLPELRGRPERLGRALSYLRFLYIGAHRATFRDEVLSELLPPLDPDGASRLWEALGRRFTGLSYQEADRLSRGNKEFIKGLFPDRVYATLLPPEAQAVIGEVGPHARGVQRMLERIGFRHAGRIDPFDGGPHYHARTAEIPIVRATRLLPVAAADAGPDAPRMLVGVDRSEPPRFCGGATPARVEDGALRLSPEARAVLGVAEGDPVWCAPFDLAPADAGEG